MKTIIVRVILYTFAVLGTILLFFWHAGTLDEGPEEYRSFVNGQLPEISFQKSGLRMAVLEGYTQEMNVEAMADTVIPVAEGESLRVYVTENGTDVETIQYEIRTMDDGHLIERQEMQLTTSAEGETYFDMDMSSLLEKGTLYRLQFSLEEETVYYYTTLAYGNVEGLEDLLDFALTFSQATLDKSTTVVSRYASSSDVSDNSNLGMVTETSSVGLLTWKDAEVSMTGERTLQLTEVTDGQISGMFVYPVTVSNGSTSYNCIVEEYFCVRQRDGKFYLISYERRTNSQFSGSKQEVSGSTIWLGIREEEPNVFASTAGGSYSVWEGGGSLWVYRKAENTITEIFTFDPLGTGTRAGMGKHGFNILQIDTEGNVDFLVYGYMAAGEREGQTGVGYYHYDQSTSSIEERAFLPSEQPFAYMDGQVGQVVYASEEGMLFFNVFDSLYGVDSSSGEFILLAEGINMSELYISESGSKACWTLEAENESNLYLLDMEENQVQTISAKEGEFVCGIGFLGEDFAYGTGNTEDILYWSGIATQMPLYKIDIVDENLEVQLQYQKEGIFILKATQDEAGIVMERAEKGADGTFSAINADVLSVTSTTQTEEGVTLNVSQDAALLRQYYLKLKASTSPQKDTLSLNYAKILQNSSREISQEVDADSLYYGYGGGELRAASEQLSDVIQKVYGTSGVVYYNGKVLWNRGIRSLYVTLSLPDLTAVHGSALKEGAYALLYAANALPGEEISETALQTDFLQYMTELTQNGLLNLTGCSANQILYYINEKKPVLAAAGSEIYLLYGYTTTEMTLWDCTTNTSQVWTQEAVQNWITTEEAMLFSIQ